MRYLLPTATNVCSYITLAKMNCQMSTCSITGTGQMSTKLLLFSKKNVKIWLENEVSLCQKLEKAVDIQLRYCKNKKVQFLRHRVLQVRQVRTCR